MIEKRERKEYPSGYRELTKLDPQPVYKASIRTQIMALRSRATIKHWRTFNRSCLSVLAHFSCCRGEGKSLNTAESLALKADNASSSSLRTLPGFESYIVCARRCT